MQAYIFDLDGTLADTLDSITFSVNKTLEAFHIQPITKEQCRAFIGCGAKVLIERSLQASGMPKEWTEKVFQKYQEVFDENCMYLVKPFEGVTETLRELKERGNKIAVLSNKPHRQTVKVIAGIFEKDFFHEVSGQKEGVPRKPDPAGALNIAKALSVNPEDCFYIGDTDVDMNTGNAAGMKTVGVLWGYRDKEVLEQSHGTYLISHMAQLLNLK